MDLIRRGDRVVITKDGREYRGFVASVQANIPRRGADPVYYIELQDDDGLSYYWKQDQDGGTVRKES